MSKHVGGGGGEQMECRMGKNLRMEWEEGERGGCVGQVLIIDFIIVIDL